MTDSRPHDAPPSRRALRALREGASARPTSDRRRLTVALLAALVLVLGTATAVTGAMTAGALIHPRALADAVESTPNEGATVVVEGQGETPAPMIDELPAPSMTGATAVTNLCADPAVATPLSAGDDAAVVAAVGGGEAMREVLSSGAVPCLRLDDPARVWTVVNKTRPYQPADYAPANLVLPAGMRSLDGSEVRTDAAAALTALAQAGVAEGAGELALESGYRSYATQQRNYGAGGADVEVSVARPGYSEHQSGLAADVVACARGGACSSMDDLAATPQGAWVAENAWRFGWIVRYEQGRTDITGYIPEPWHLRYVGVDLARAYHDGGWHTLEEFFGLPAAPTY